MAKTYKTVITDAGAALVAQCILDGTRLRVTQAAAGDGGGAYYLPDPSQQGLRGEKWRGGIASCERSAAKENMVDVKVVLPEGAEGFTVREMALFAEDGTCVAVCNTPDVERAAAGSGTSGRVTLIMHIVVADASVLSVTVSPALDTLSREEAAGMIADALEGLRTVRPCRIVIGTSTAGWTAGDCDFLCDGAHDEEELTAALDALPEAGGEIRFLDGVYHFEEPIHRDCRYGGSTGQVSFTGCGTSSVLEGGGFAMGGGSETVRPCYAFRHLKLQGMDLNAINCALILEGSEIENGRVSVMVQYNGFFARVAGNRFLWTKAPEPGCTTVSVTGLYQDLEVCVEGNTLRVEDGAGGALPNGIQAAGIGTVRANQIAVGFRDAISVNGAVDVSGNFISGGSLELNYGCTASGNRIVDGSMTVLGFVELQETVIGPGPSASGNVFQNSTLYASGMCTVTGNTFGGQTEGACISAAKAANNANELVGPVISGNWCAGGAVGILLRGNEYSLRDAKNALVTGNRCMGNREAAIKIEDVWSGCLITNNLCSGSILDNGTGNTKTGNQTAAG